jgi:hypothetical protein
MLVLAKALLKKLIYFSRLDTHFGDVPGTNQNSDGLLARLLASGFLLFLVFPAGGVLSAAF